MYDTAVSATTIPNVSQPPHAVMRGLGLLGIMFEVGRGVGVYVVAASGTAVSAPPSILSLHTLLYAGMH